VELAAVGLGSGLALASAMRAALRARPAQPAAVTTLSTAARQLGGAAGVAVIGAVAATAAGHAMPGAVAGIAAPAYLTGMHAGMAVGAGLTLATVVLVVLT
jgi:hypothetical protein